MTMMKRYSVLPIMLMTGMWMTGCAGSQKPKLAPANTALGTLQRAELKLKEGKKAQKSQDYKVALASHLQAVEMAESVSTKYPKDPNTAKFLKKPMLGKVWVDDVKLKTIPLLRQQSLISEDILGWAIVEIEQLEANRRKSAYRQLFDALYYARDYENIERLINLVKDETEQRTLDQWNKRVERSKKLDEKSKSTFNLTKTNNKVYNMTRLLDEGKYKAYMEAAVKEPDYETRRKLIRAMIGHLDHNANGAMAKDSAFLKTMITEGFWSRLPRSKNRYGSSFFLTQVMRRHKKLGFASKEAVAEHILADLTKRPAGLPKLHGMFILTDRKGAIKDEAKRKKLLVESANALLAQSKSNADIPQSLYSRAVYAIGRKENLDATTLPLAESLAKAAPKNTYLLKQIEFYKTKLAGEKTDIKTLDELPVVTDLKALKYADSRKMRSAMYRYVRVAQTLAKQKDTKSIKTLQTRVETSLKAILAMMEGDFDKQKFDVKNLIIVHRTTLMAFYALQGDNKNLTKTVGELIALNNKSAIFDANTKVVAEHLVSGKMSDKERAALETEVLKLSKMDPYGWSMARYFKPWLSQKLAKKDTKSLETWLNGYEKPRAKARALSALAEQYNELETRPTDNTLSKWMVAQLNGIALKKYDVPRMDKLVAMCKQPEAQCVGDLQNYFRSGKISDYAQRVVVEDLARNKHLGIARQWIEQITKEENKALAKLYILQAELTETGDYNKIKPELISTIEAIGKLPKNEQRRRWRTIYNMHSFTDRCAELNELLSTRKEEGISYYSAAYTCARSSSNFSNDHPTSVFKMTQNIKKGSERQAVIVRFIGRYGVVKTPALQKILLEVAAKKAEGTESAAPKNAAPMTDVVTPTK